ncbi:MAG: response regulator [Pseudomonadales bacterium]|jgi:FixJ family two-component response regulator|nr:response regulator [Pseudomonadales bacterium]
MNISLNNRPSDHMVCVVDGDPAVRDSLQYLCSSQGYPALGFSTCAAFLRMLDTQMSARSVICEAQLPDGNGLDLFQELRRRGMEVPFALLMSRVSLPAVTLATRMGVEYVWPKPLVDRAPLIRFLDG